MEIQRVEKTLDPQGSLPIDAIEARGIEVINQHSSKASFRKFVAEAPVLQVVSKDDRKEKAKAGVLHSKEFLMKIDPRVVIHKGILNECNEEDGYLLNIPRKRRFRRHY